MNTTPEMPSSLLGSATPESDPPPDNPLAAPDPANPQAPPPEEGPPVGEGVPQAPSEAPSPLSITDLVAPEGLALEVDGKLVPEAEEFLTLANEHKLSKEAASAVLALYPKLLEKAAGEYAASWEATQQDWQKQVQEMPEFGGANLKASLTAAAKVLDKYGDKEVRDALNMSGLGNHPAVFRMIVKIAKDMNETPPVSGTPATTGTKPLAERMFGTPKGN
jgi:hypothetical protein